METCGSRLLAEESRARGGVEEALFSPYAQFGGGGRRGRVDNTTRVGLATDVDGLAPDAAFRESGGSTERAALVWEGTQLRRNGEAQVPRGACEAQRVLPARPGAEAEAQGQRLPNALDALQPGDRVGVLVEGRCATFFVNGVAQGQPEELPARGREQPLHLVIDLRGTAARLRLTSATQPLTPADLEVCRGTAVTLDRYLTLGAR